MYPRRLDYRVATHGWAPSTTSSTPIGGAATPALTYPLWPDQSAAARDGPEAQSLVVVVHSPPTSGIKPAVGSPWIRFPTAPRHMLQTTLTNDADRSVRNVHGARMIRNSLDGSRVVGGANCRIMRPEASSRRWRHPRVPQPPTTAPWLGRAGAPDDSGLSPMSRRGGQPAICSSFWAPLAPRSLHHPHAPA